MIIWTIIVTIGFVAVALFALVVILAFNRRVQIETLSNAYKHGLEEGQVCLDCGKLARAYAAAGWARIALEKLERTSAVGQEGYYREKIESVRALEKKIVDLNGAEFTKEEFMGAIVGLGNPDEVARRLSWKSYSLTEEQAADMRRLMATVKRISTEKYLPTDMHLYGGSNTAQEVAQELMRQLGLNEGPATIRLQVLKHPMLCKLVESYITLNNMYLAESAERERWKPASERYEQILSMVCANCCRRPWQSD
jgi:hypothetical protein